jgi:membrane-associated phospholipid phosphatase
MRLALSLERIGRSLPHGWGDFLRQVAIWLGFVLGYQLARGLADRGPEVALRNAERIVDLERRLIGLVEIDVQRRALDAGEALVHAANWTYWLSQFAVVSATLLWVYLRRNHGYLPLRNTLIVANTIGLVGYVALPTAPPRMLPELGLLDTLADSEALNHGSGIVELASNPYAAMPSLHAADALIVGVALFALVRRPVLRGLFLLYPLWVWFSLVATANHFWLDVVAGIVLAAIGAALASLFTPGMDVRGRGPSPEPRPRESTALSGSAR